MAKDLEDQGAAPDWGLSNLVSELREARIRWRSTHHPQLDVGARRFPSRAAIEKIIDELKAALFPMRLATGNISEGSEDFFVGHTLNIALTSLTDQIALELDYVARQDDGDHSKPAQPARDIARDFAKSLPHIRALLDSDVEAAFLGDPAARSVDEVLLCYPGLVAITHHRIAHRLYQLGAGLVARLISEIAHSQTGIDIHPGAEIGNSFFIDHGTGVVIGETAIIGDRVRLYQAVTLGARSFPLDGNGWLKKDLPRHPILEDEVIVYAGATILGRVRIGAGSTIGGNVWLTESVPPGSRVNQAHSRHDADHPQILPVPPLQAANAPN